MSGEKKTVGPLCLNRLIHWCCHCWPIFSHQLITQVKVNHRYDKNIAVYSFLDFTMKLDNKTKTEGICQRAIHFSAAPQISRLSLANNVLLHSVCTSALWVQALPHFGVLCHKNAFSFQRQLGTSLSFLSFILAHLLSPFMGKKNLNVNTPFYFWPWGCGFNLKCTHQSSSARLSSAGVTCTWPVRHKPGSSRANPEKTTRSCSFTYSVHLHRARHISRIIH